MKSMSATVTAAIMTSGVSRPKSPPSIPRASLTVRFCWGVALSSQDSGPCDAGTPPEPAYHSTSLDVEPR